MPFIAFSDIPSGIKSGWSPSEPDRGAAVTIWGQGFGDTRGNSYVTVNGVDLTDDTDYPEPWGQTGKPVPFLQSICFYLNSSMADGAGTITVTVGGSISNAIAFNIHAGRILFMSTRTDNGTGTEADPFQSSQWAVKALDQQLGDICYLRAGTYDRSINNYYNFWMSDALKGTQALPFAFIGYPNERPYLYADTGASGIRRNFGSVPEYWTIAKMDWYALKTGANQRGTFGANMQGNVRWVGIDSEGLKEHDSGSGLINTINGGNKVYGCALHGIRTDNSLDHAVYPSCRLECDDLASGEELAWNYTYDNVIDKGPSISLNHRGTGATRVNVLTHVKEIRVHHNYIDARSPTSADVGEHRGIGVPDLGSMRGTEVTPAEPPYIYNNIIRGEPTATDTGDNNAHIYFTDDDHSGYIYNNVCWEYGGYGIGVSARNPAFSSAVHTRNNIVQTTLANTWGEAVKTVDQAANTSNNCYYGGDSAGYIGSSRVLAESLFNHDPVTWTMSLPSNSPCRGAGSAAANTQLSRDWNAVLYESINDIGAVLYAAPVDNTQSTSIDYKHPYGTLYWEHLATGGSWQDALNLSGYASGQGTRTLTLSGSTPAETGLLGCTVTNPAGASVDSDDAQLIGGGSAPSITTGIHTQEPYEGTTATFGPITVTGSPTPTLYWEAETSNGSGSWADVESVFSGRVTGQGLTAINISSTVVNDTRGIRVTATNTAGTDVSQAALTVTIGLDFVEHPQNATMIAEFSFYPDQPTDQTITAT